MLEKPDLPDDRIVAGLRDGYGLDVVRLEFLPVGSDRLAWSYQADARDGETWFVKVRQGAVDAAGLAVPRALQQAGVARVIAPIPPVSSAHPWAVVEDYALILYPFIRGQNAKGLVLTDPQWAEFGRILQAVHAARLPEAVLHLVSRETFVSAWAAGVRRVQTRIDASAGRDQQCRALAAVWRERDARIKQILERTDALGRRLRGRAFDFVQCHTDPHRANLLLDRVGRLFLVDWDAPLLAPRERDLHFVVESIVAGPPIGPREEALFFRGYGTTAIDWDLLTYYRYEWLCGDLLELAERALDVEHTGEATREDAIRSLRGMFEPGRAVDSADALERRRPAEA